MNSSIFLLPAVVSIAFLTACERQPKVIVVEKRPEVLPEARTKTFETTRLASEVDRYSRTPSAESAAAVQSALEELDAEIAELERKVNDATGDRRAEVQKKILDLKQYRAAEEARFLKAKAAAAAPVSAEPLPRTEASEVGEKIKASAQRAGDEIERAARKTG